MDKYLFFRLTVIVTVLQGTCWSYVYFQGSIPSGNKVPNPCKPDQIWQGVGHKLLEGTGARNPFGLDFFANGKQWNRTLCEMDSDQDGLTNGMELGDPNCTWTQGDVIPEGLTISHPGVCEPWNDPKCLALDQDWVMDICQPKGFDCDAINGTGVFSKTIRLPSISVPSKETTYMCQIFSIPDEEYHMIATTPIIDNTHVVHHIVLFGCLGESLTTDAPFECGMLPSRNCSNIISVWTPGSAGECLHSNVGIKVGKNGFQKVALQIHWNNPANRDNYSDQSGMTMYLTPNLREQNAGILTTGQTFLWIPPQEPSVTMEARFSPECSQRVLTGNIYITAVLNHMHYLGSSQSLILYRNGNKEREIAVDQRYNYDNPKLHVFNEPIEVRPGDELRTTCVYSTMSRNYTTQFGDATSDEMCYSFITYYPRENSKFSFATSSKSIGNCHFGEESYLGCNLRDFPDLTDPPTLRALTYVTNACTLFDQCTPACFEAVQQAKQHNCLKGDIWDLLIYRLFGSIDGINFLLRLQSCACGPSDEVFPVSPVDESKSVCDWPGLVAKGAFHPLYKFYTNIVSRCVATNMCLKECIPAVMEARRNPCFQGAEWKFGREYLHGTLDSRALEFILDFESCNCQIKDMPKPETSTPVETATTPTVGAAAISTTSLGTMVVMTLCGLFF